MLSRMNPIVYASEVIISAYTLSDEHASLNLVLHYLFSPLFLVLNYMLLLVVHLPDDNMG